MCVHLIGKSNSALNKIADEINEQYNDMDSLSEFAGYCKYLDSGNDLMTNSSDLKVLHLNVRSILSKQSDFVKLLSNNKVDICTINETWLKKDNKHLLKLHDYICVTQEHKTGKGGGVGIAISKNLKFHRREDLENCLEMLEVCIIELLGRKRKVLIASVYRAPNSNDKEFSNGLRKLIEMCKNECNCEIIIGLDHNYDLLKSHTHRATQDLIDLLLNSDLWPVITKPTRITKNSATLIDNILVSPNIYGSYQCSIMLDDLSDHLPCILSGVIIMTKTWSLVLSVFIASSMSGWSGYYYLSVWQTGVCLIYSGLTQGQGHTVRHPLLFDFFEPNFGLVYLQLISRGLPFRIQYTVKSLRKTR